MIEKGEVNATHKLEAIVNALKIYWVDIIPIRYVEEKRKVSINADSE
jgi:hypothetical protein